MILLSAVTVNLNNSEGLIRTCRSIRVLKEKEWFEHVIVDGGSGDGSVEKIPLIDLVKTRVISEKDKGIYDGMNKGIIASRGTYVWMLNSGDEFVGDVLFLEQYILAMERNGIDLALFGAQLRDLDLGVEKKHFANFRKLSYMMSVIHQSVLIRRSIHRRYGLYSLRYKLSSDYDFISLVAGNRSVKASISKRSLSIFYMGGLTDKQFWRSRLESVHSIGCRNIFISLFSAAFFSATFVKISAKKIKIYFDDWILLKYKERKES